MPDHPIEGRQIPQARSLDTIREVVRSASAAAVSPEVVSLKIPLSLRHADYHLVAAVTLGLLRETQEGFCITTLGRALLDTEQKSTAEAKIFAEGILSSTILATVAPNLLDRVKDPPIAQLIKAIQNSSGLAFSTAEARAQTLLAWRKRIVKSLSAEAQLSLAISPQSQQTPTLRSISLKDWKSFESAELFIDTLTILIGANASGKSNALDALEFLRRIADRDDLRSALGGASGQQPVRGGVEWATRCGTANFTLGAVVASADERYSYHYLVTIETQAEVNLVAESLERRDLRTPQKAGIFLFRTDPPDPKSPGKLVARLYNAKAGTKRDAVRSNSILRQFSGLTRRSEIEHGISTVRRALTGVLSLDPVPSRMRQYSALSESLDQHGANVAGVLAALAPGPKERTEVSPLHAA